MKTFKRIISVVMSLLLVYLMLSFGASAEAVADGTVDIVITPSKSANLYPGDIITYTINIKNNYNATAMRWPVMFQSKILEIVENEDDDERAGNVRCFGQLSAAGSSIKAVDASANASLHNNAYNMANYGCLLIQWLGNTNNSRVNYYNAPTGSNCISFQLRVKENPVGTVSGETQQMTAKVIIPSGTPFKTYFYNNAIADPSTASTIYTLDSLTVTCDETNISTYKEAAAIKPQLNSDTIIDSTNHFIYGLTAVATADASIGEETDVARFVATAGGATYTLTPNLNGIYSTGATCSAFDAKGNSLGVYTFVLIGDPNGDGVIDSSDAAEIEFASLGGPEYAWEDDVWANAFYLACDTTADGVVDGNDVGPAVEQANGVGYVGQVYDSENFFITTN